MIDSSTPCYRHQNTPAAVGCQRCDRPICTACMRQASVGYHCSECVSNFGQKVVPAQAILNPSRPVATALIAINVIVYIAQQMWPEMTLHGLLYGPSVVQENQWWRIITSAFMHGSLLHIGFNCYALWVFSQQLERAVGTVKFLALYLAGMLGAAFTVLVFNYDAPTLGASGAVLGLVAAIAAIYGASGGSLRDSGLMTIIGINLALPLLIPQISFWGHLGGMLGGYLAGQVIARTTQR